jgi:hypothetical protein
MSDCARAVCRISAGLSCCFIEATFPELVQKQLVASELHVLSSMQSHDCAPVLFYWEIHYSIAVTCCMCTQAEERAESNASAIVLAINHSTL